MVKKFCCLTMFILSCFAFTFSYNIQSAVAAPSNTPDITAGTMHFINPDNAALKNELMEMLKDDTNKQQLQNYINETRPVIEKYKGRFESAFNASLWTEENIPVMGHLLSNVIMSITNYFYQNELEEMATTDVAKKFAQLRSSSIHTDLNIFQQAITQYVINKGVNFSLMVNLQELINEKSESVDFLRSVIDGAGLKFEPIDTGTVIPKL